MRIASLLASATETVCALGLQDQLVAISHECDYPPEALDRPRVSRPRFDPAGVPSGAVAGVRERAERLVASFEERLARAGRAGDHAERPGVLAIEWLDPPFVPGHWGPEMIELAGGRWGGGPPRRAAQPGAG